MVQLRRLDPLANSGPYQRLLKSPVKSFTLSEAQYDRVKAARPEHIVAEGEAALVGRPYCDRLEVHYGFPEPAAFKEHFVDMANRLLAASSKAEAPRGVLLSFRDRPNRSLAETTFWSLAMEAGEEWVEMSYVAVPELPEPDDSGGEGFGLRELTDADREAVATIEAEVSGAPRLSPAGLASLTENASLFRVVLAADAAVGFLRLQKEPGGWGVVEELALRPASAEALRRPLTEWSIAWLRNNGSRRLRRQVGIDAGVELALLRELGFTPGESGLNFGRPVDASEIETKITERKAHGTVIRFGDWH